MNSLNAHYLFVAILWTSSFIAHAHIGNVFDEKLLSGQSPVRFHDHQEAVSQRHHESKPEGRQGKISLTELCAHVDR